MERLPRVGERVRVGTYLGTVVRVVAVRRQVEVKLDSGVSMTIDVLCLQPAEEETHADS